MESLNAYFKQFPKTALNATKVVVIDMSQTYRAIATTFFRKARIVIDKFHVVKHLMEGFDSYRKRKQREGRDHKDIYYQNRHALCATFDRLTNEAQLKLAELFVIDPELKIVHELKEEFLAIYSNLKLNREEAERAIAVWVQKVRERDIPELLAFVATYENWKEYILNYFDYRYTNGLMEGLNNKNKVIQRMSYGFQLFETLRGKLLFELSMS